MVKNMYPNVSKTRAFYLTLSETDLCSCDYCRSYRAQIKSAYPDVTAYLASLGVDIEKPFETSPLEPDESGTLNYCACQYIVFGQCAPDYHHKIDHVEFRKAVSYPSTGIAEEHFVIEFFPIRLKYAP